MQSTIPIYIILGKFKIVTVGNKYPLAFAFSRFKEIKVYIPRNGLLEDFSPHFTITLVAIITTWSIHLKNEKKRV